MIERGRKSDGLVVGDCRWETFLLELDSKLKGITLIQ